MLAGAAGVAPLPACRDGRGRGGRARRGRRDSSAPGGAVVVVCDPGAYLARYAAPDKAGSGLDDATAWPVPYWFGDAAFATMALLLLAEEDGLAGLLPRSVSATRQPSSPTLGAPSGRRLFGAVLLGHAASVQVPLLVARSRRAESCRSRGPRRVP